MSKREKLQRQIDEINNISSRKDDSPEFNSRKAKTNRILESIFWKDSSYQKDFWSISYRPWAISYDTTDEEMQVAYLQWLYEAKLLLGWMLEEIDEEPEEIILDINIDFWKLFKQELIDVSKKLFDDWHYSNSVFEAMKLVNNKVKKIVFDKTWQELDWSDLMNKAFSLDKTIIKLTELQTISGKDIQRWYMDLFRWSILAIRNPKWHDNNILLEKEKAIHFLFLANLLLIRLEEAWF